MKFKMNLSFARGRGQGAVPTACPAGRRRRVPVCCCGTAAGRQEPPQHKLTVTAPGPWAERSTDIRIECSAVYTSSQLGPAWLWLAGPFEKNLNKKIFMSSPACADGYDTPAQQREDPTTFMKGGNIRPGGCDAPCGHGVYLWFESHDSRADPRFIIGPLLLSRLTNSSDFAIIHFTQPSYFSVQTAFLL